MLQTVEENIGKEDETQRGATKKKERGNSTELKPHNIISLTHTVDLSKPCGRGESPIPTLFPFLFRH